MSLMNNLGQTLETAAYRAALVLIGCIPGLFIEIEGSPLGSVNRLLGIGVTLLWIGGVLTSGRLRRPHLFHGLALAFSLWYVLSLSWSVAPGESPFLTTMVQGVALTVVLWDILRTHARVHAAMQAFLLGGYVGIATTLFNYVQGQQARQWETRFAGSGFDPNDLALLEAIGIPLAAYLATVRSEGRHRAVTTALRVLNLLYPLAAGLLIVLTGSRGALVAAVPGYLFAFALVARAGGRWRLAAGAALLLVLGGASRLNLAQPLQRLGSVAASGSQDRLSGRADLWQAGWAAYAEHPVLGVGAGAFAAATRARTNLGESLIAHNTYLSVLTELGAVGFALFGSLLLVVIGGALRQPPPMRGASLAALAVWGVGVFALSWEFRSQTWLLFTLIMAGGHCGGEPIRAVPEGAP